MASCAKPFLIVKPVLRLPVLRDRSVRPPNCIFHCRPNLPVLTDYIVFSPLKGLLRHVWLYIPFRWVPWRRSELYRMLSKYNLREIFWWWSFTARFIKICSQRLQKLIYLHLSTDCFMRISLQFMGLQTVSWRFLFNQQDVCIVFAHKTLHWALYHMWFQKNLNCKTLFISFWFILITDRKMNKGENIISFNLNRGPQNHIWTKRSIFDYARV